MRFTPQQLVLSTLQKRRQSSANSRQALLEKRILPTAFYRPFFSVGKTDGFSNRLLPV